MAQAPRTIGIYLCKQLAVDATKAEMSLVGVFQGLTFDRFPSPLQRFTVYAMLYDGEGEGVIEVRILQVITEAEVYRYRRWTAFAQRGIQVPFEAQVKSCVFPAPGRYTVELRFDGELVDTRILEVFAA